MAESFSIERRKLMRFLGARVVLTNPAHKGTGMVIKAKELADKHGWFFPNQFDNEANAWIHEMTTGTSLRETLLCKLLFDFILILSFPLVIRA
jgi:cysteine synthase A